MSAREELHESMCGSCSGSFAHGECESVDRVIDNFAHELAQQIRVESRKPSLFLWIANSGSVQATAHAMADHLADLIDPEAQR